MKLLGKQESPPAWTQEAYRPPCSEYSFCCPTWVPPPGGGPGTPPTGGGPGTPRGVTQSGTPPGTPGGGYPPPLPHGILGNVAKHYEIWVPPPRCGQTNKVKLLPSRRTTYAGGNNWRNVFYPFLTKVPVSQEVLGEPVTTTLTHTILQTMTHAIAFKEITV